MLPRDKTFVGNRVGEIPAVLAHRNIVILSDKSHQHLFVGQQVILQDLEMLVRRFTTEAGPAAVQSAVIIHPVRTLVRKRFSHRKKQIRFKSGRQP